MLDILSQPICSYFLYGHDPHALERQIAAICGHAHGSADIFVFCDHPQLAVPSHPNITYINYQPSNLREKLALANMASGEFICILDSDFIPMPAWFAEVIAWQEHYEAALVQNGQIFIGNPESFSVNPERDYWCESGSGWYFFPAAWLPQIIADTAKYGRFCGTPLLSLGKLPSRSLHLASIPPQVGWNNADNMAFPEQPIKICIRYRDERLLRTLLSIKGQKYRNYQCFIAETENAAALKNTLSRIDGNEERFRIVEKIDYSDFHSGDILLDLHEQEWLAHPDVLNQLNRILAVCDRVLCPTVSFAGPVIADTQAPYHPGGPSGCIACSPDLGFIAGRTDDTGFPHSNSPLPISPIRQKLEPVCALSTVVTPDYLPEALLSLGSYSRNCKYRCEIHIFVATTDQNEINRIKSAFKASSFHLLFPDDFIYQTMHAKGMKRRYPVGSNEYRWGMKSVVLSELLAKRYQAALHLDPDIHAVSDISDVHSSVLQHDISIFPHFRDPDNLQDRKFLYQDGFFNGGMLGATVSGLPHLIKLSERCLKEMKRDRLNNLYDDQK